MATASNECRETFIRFRRPAFEFFCACEAVLIVVKLEESLENEKAKIHNSATHFVSRIPPL
jgi:hypothetical protein